MEAQREWVAAPVTQHVSDVEPGWMGRFAGGLSHLPGWVPVFQLPRNWQVVVSWDGGEATGGISECGATTTDG